jgi:NTP pyrophosphatase (non-canonical NTP hydrolase)
MDMSNNEFPNEMRTLADFQAFHRWLDERKQFDPDIMFNMVLLTAEVGEAAEVLKQIRKKARGLQKRQDVPPTGAMESALADYREELGAELADCLSYIFKLANYCGVDLQEAYPKKMAVNIHRIWHAVDESID